MTVAGAPTPTWMVTKRKLSMHHSLGGRRTTTPRRVVGTSTRTRTGNASRGAGRRRDRPAPRAHHRRVPLGAPTARVGPTSVVGWTVAGEEPTGPQHVSGSSSHAPT